MYFKSSGRTNPSTRKFDLYYRLVESYRNEVGRICHRTILNIGFLDDELSLDQRNQIARRLTDMYEHKQSLFGLKDDLVKKWVTELWSRIIAGGKLDLTLFSPQSRKVDIDSLKHSNVREVGTEWICYNIWQELGIDKILEENDFTEQEIKLAQTQVISRAVHPNSELATARWIKENSAITEITGYETDQINKDKLYKSALKLNSIQDELQNHLSIKTNEIFDIKDSIVLYDLTNTYFEGEKRNSKLANYGRSKEKRSDAKLVVLALVVNVYGFIKYSCIHEGNYADSTNLENLIDKLNKNTQNKNPLIVIDAGIATSENLNLITSKGCHYLCVSRTKPKDIQYDSTSLTTFYETKNKGELILKTATASNINGRFVEVQSAKKALKEKSMYDQFTQRFEADLIKIKSAIHKKGGVKKPDSVHQRIGRARQKYPSVQKMYNIVVQLNEKKDRVIEIYWNIKEEQKDKANNNQGKYYLQTSLPYENEAIVWMIYNLIREIEQTFRTLKTDLDLRPIYHKNDDATIAHLNLGLLAYWLVNTIRTKLKAHGYNRDWQEIKRIGNTQKVITTTGTNTTGQTIEVRKCSEPEEKLKELQRILLIKNRPFTKLKSVVHKPKLKIEQSAYIRALQSG
jgi:transposase